VIENIYEATTMVNEKYEGFAFKMIEHAAHRKALFMAEPVKPTIRNSYFFGGKLAGLTIFERYEQKVLTVPINRKEVSQ